MLNLNFIISLITTMNKIRKWCNANSGFLTAIGIIVTIVIAIANTDKLSWGNTTSFFYKVVALLNYKIQLPIYLLVIIVILFLIYFNRIRNRYRRNYIDFNFLVGRWLNEWDLNGPNQGSEELEIREDGSYYRNNEHIFDVVDFKYDYKSNQIYFIKESRRVGDDRKAKNTLTVVNNDLLSGTEINYKIRYTRLT